MRALALIVIFVASAATGQDWRPLSGEEIRAALTDRALDYGAASQTFMASGRTVYTSNGRPEQGSWRVAQDQYCSAWPPSDLWACYVMEQSGDSVRFIGAQGGITVGRYID